MAGAALYVPQSYIAIVAIDFGTTFSGFAFSFLHLEGEPGIHLNKDWGNEQGYQTAKAPTSVLLTPEKIFDKFGYEAAEQYAQLEEPRNRDVFFFERFKMLLHHKEVFASVYTMYTAYFRNPFLHHLDRLDSFQALKVYNNPGTGLDC